MNNISFVFEISKDIRIDNRDESIEKIVKEFLKEDNKRLSHIMGVVNEMESLANALKMNTKEKDLMLKTAYLHDVGYSKKLVNCGFHPIDGALFVEKLGMEKSVVMAILFHTGAEKDVLEMDVKYQKGYEIYKKALTEKDLKLIEYITYCDIQRNSLGEKVTLDERIKEIEKRYGLDHVVSKLINTKRKGFELLIAQIDEKKKRNIL